ncbi:Mif2/CENP-C like-domain-containing protein [Xylaria sp. FL0064]|nr:Mif2/CENP-C like-domain-containing protein [Xylaria sp. FL0064]
MAPRGSVQRRQTQSQNEHVFALGKVGRKTGITIPDNGRRDEHGFEELDNLFSSPDRELQAATNGRNRTVSDDEQDEQDMEIDDGSELGPATTRKLQQGRLSLPRARSPIKTNLKSPARQNLHLPPNSSPSRGTVVTTREQSSEPEVTRKLDFSKSTSSHARAAPIRVKPFGSRQLSKPNPNAARSDSPIFSDPHAPPSDPIEEEEEEEEDEHLDLIDGGAVDGGDIEDETPEEPDEEIEEEEEPVVQQPKPTSKSKPPGRRGRKPKASIETENDGQADTSLDSATAVEGNEKDEEPVKKRKGRPKAAPKPEKVPSPLADSTPPPKASKRGRQARSSSDDAEEGQADSRGAKRHKTSAAENKTEKSAASKPAPTKEKSKPGRKRKSSGIGVDSPKIQQGPPLPKSRGLVTVRREETTAMKTTRSGRASFKPLEWWKGEHVEYDEDQENLFADSGRHFKMPTVKGIVRTEESEPAPKRRGRQPGGRKPGRALPAVVEAAEVERDDWEYDPGRVTGEVICWQPDHEFQPPEDDDEIEIVHEELAISENAIQLKDIKDATFKFAKTLTLPFFGAGVVDLPPGAEKRPKNSRMRHLVFFVHTGNVQVTIAQTEFGIAMGGMFFVPRGNDYRILNDTDRPARIFFAQGNEMYVQPDVEA